MITRFLFWLLFQLEGGDTMMAMFFAQRVILGKTEFNDVPESLKSGVYENLKDSGVEFLAGDYVPPTKA